MFQQCSFSREVRALLPVAASTDLDVDCGRLRSETAGAIFLHCVITRTAGNVSLIPFGSLDGVNFFELPTDLWQLNLTPAVSPPADPSDRYILLDGAVPRYLRLRLSTNPAWVGSVAVNLRSSGPA